MDAANDLTTCLGLQVYYIRLPVQVVDGKIYFGSGNSKNLESNLCPKVVPSWITTGQALPADTFA